MPIVFPKSGNPIFPLPPDYDDLTPEGQKLARVNATAVTGTPELEVASWQFFREYYLMPEESGWYTGAFVPSPQKHLDWVRDWYSHPRQIFAAPRGSCKTTINLEDILRQVVRGRFWECALFLSTREFCTDRLGRLAGQLENNARIIDDFGKQRPKRGQGTWNRGSILETVNHCKVAAKPITGASLGTRPSGLVVLDDVEQSKEQVINPGDVRKGFHDFFFNGILPMARMPGADIPMRVIGTLYSRKMFIHWLATTEDPRITEWFERTILDVYDMDWREGMGPEWIEEQKRQLGTAFGAQCLNTPTAEGDALLKVHPELTTYYTDKRDQAYHERPLLSSAEMVTHQVERLDTKTNPDTDEVTVTPIARRLVRPFGTAVQGMYRFLTVDYATTIGQMSDYSAAQVMGLDSSEDHPNTLFSLDAWMGKVTRNVLVKIIIDMALKWQVNVIGIEAYPLQMELFERFQQDIMPAMEKRLADGAGHTMPAIMPLKFPTTMSKEEKIKGMAWRFDQFRVKLPVDRDDEIAYKALWDQVRLFTDDGGMLENDDILDTLAMHQRIAKGAPAAAVAVAPKRDPDQAILNGELVDDMGMNNMEAVIATGKLTDEIADAYLSALEDENARNEAIDWIGY